MADSQVTNNQSAHQFELTADGETAVLTYRLQPGSITFVHTGVPEKLEGRGIAKQLAAAGLEFAREHGLTVVPLCPYVAGYIKRHPEYLDLVRHPPKD
ncbi:MAG: N-acetyltransferase [Bryobacterales bacterium]|nr:N-acetyltransferase [Bryobacterales bacterium]